MSTTKSGKIVDDNDNMLTFENVKSIYYLDATFIECYSLLSAEKTYIAQNHIVTYKRNIRQILFSMILR